MSSKDVFTLSQVVVSSPIVTSGLGGIGEGGLKPLNFGVVVPDKSL